MIGGGGQWGGSLPHSSYVWIFYHHHWEIHELIKQLRASEKAHYVIILFSDAASVSMSSRSRNIFLWIKTVWVKHVCLVACVDVKYSFLLLILNMWLHFYISLKTVLFWKNLCKFQHRRLVMNSLYLSKQDYCLYCAALTHTEMTHYCLRTHADATHTHTSAALHSSLWNSALRRAVTIAAT